MGRQAPMYADSSMLPFSLYTRHRFVSSALISLKLRIRAVVWKKGAHQPGGPPLRTTAARHFRSSPPGMDAEARSVGFCKKPGPERYGSNATEAICSPSRRILLVAWGGDRLCLLSEAPKTRTTTAHSAEYRRVGEEHERC